MSTQQPRQQPPGHLAPGRRSAAIPRAAAVVSGALAVACLIWSVSPALSAALGGVRHYLDLYYLHAPGTSVLWALFAGWTGVLAARRKRLAWWMLVLYSAGWLPYNLVELLGGRDIHAGPALVLHTAVLGVLIAARSQFPARVRACAVRPALLTGAVGVLVTGIAGWALVQAFPGSLVSGTQRGLWVVSRLTATVLPGESRIDGAPPFGVSFLLGIMGALAVAAALWVLLRTQQAEYALTSTDEMALRALLDRPDADSLGYFNTRRDRSVIFAPNGNAALGYRVENGLCLALGDPIGERDSWPQAVTAWQQYARRFGWPVAVVGASEASVPIYERAGLIAVPAGAEAVLDTRSFSLAAPGLKPVRPTVGRLRKQGMSVRIRRHRDVGTAELARFAVDAQRWRHSETVRGYPLPVGRLGDRQDGDCLLVEATDSDDRVLGMLSLVPWGPTGMALDLVRCADNAPEGLLDFLVCELALHAEQHGVHRVSLNLSLFRSVFEAAGQTTPAGRPRRGSTLRRGVRILPLAFSRWWQLDQLYRTALRYQPLWVSRATLCADPADLPRIALAAALAEGLLPRVSGKSAAFTHTGRHPATTERPLRAAFEGPPAPDLVPDTGQLDHPEQTRVRAGKLAELVAAGNDPYPKPFPPTHTVAAARRVPRGTTVRVSGRVLRIRDHGGVLFALVRDWSSDIQLLIERERVGAHRCTEFGTTIDLGDLISVSGQLGASRHGELSLLVADWRMLGKCLHPLPHKWHGLTDSELRLRYGYLDLMIDQEARRLLARRSAVLRSMRDTLHDWGFLEVTTPVLRQDPGALTGRGLRTHIDADNLDLQLRTSPELALKRLCVAGVEKVFELGPGFRNTRSDPRHVPEFTLLQGYEAHSDHSRTMTLCRQLVQQAAGAAHDAVVALRPAADGYEMVDISGEWPVRPMYRALSEQLGVEITAETETADLRELCEKTDVRYQRAWDRDRLAYTLYQQLVATSTTTPTFYCDFPATTAPFARRQPNDPELAQRWELVAWGLELGTGRSELTDPVQQRRRLTAQTRLAADGGPATRELDDDLLHALEYAMPPTGGFGIGVDRVIMLLTGRAIRETQPFPLVRPR